MKYVLSGMLIVLLITACKNEIDFDLYRSEIKALHEKEIEAHKNKNFEFFAEDISDDYFSVGRGDINFPEKDEIIQRFKNYLTSTEFTQYKDLQEPIIEFSDDGSIAWAIVQVRVAGKRAMPDSTLVEFDTIWAWITLYRRIDNRWIRLGEVSNYKPGEEQ